MTFMKISIMSKTSTTKPATLHLLACASLDAFQNAILARHWGMEVGVNHRMVFTQVFFLVCDAIRDDGCNVLPVQADFDSTNSSDWLRLPTITNVLDQCVASHWMTNPRDNAMPNYGLTAEGQLLATQWPTIASTSVNISTFISTLLDGWSEEKRGLSQLRIPLLDAAARAYWSATAYPYYNTGSDALKPYFEGVRKRANS
jgi:hypothetical protein